MSEITYDDKVDLQVATNIANINKVTASDMNEIKNVVNDNAENVGDITTLTTTDKTSVVNAVNEINAPEKWVSVGTTAPTDGRRVWFAKGKNLFDIDNAYHGTINGSGVVGPNEGFRTTQNISTQPGKTYYFSTTQISGTTGNQIYIAYYNNSGTFVSRTSYNVLKSAFTTPANCYYMRAGVRSENQENIMLNEGATELPYEPYVDPSINVDGEEWYKKSGWVNKTTELTISNSNIQTTRTFLLVNETLRLAYLQVFYNANISSTTIQKPISYPLKYKPALLESDRVWFTMSPSNGGSNTARGSIQYNTTETFINILNAQSSVASPFGSIMYPY